LPCPASALAQNANRRLGGEDGNAAMVHAASLTETIPKCPACSVTHPGQSAEGRKQFFFEKKNQKTFAYWARACGQSKGVKVFCFFFSKKKTFL
jgi:hypothetical protein